MGRGGGVELPDGDHAPRAFPSRGRRDPQPAGGPSRPARQRGGVSRAQAQDARRGRARRRRGARVGRLPRGLVFRQRRAAAQRRGGGGAHGRRGVAARRHRARLRDLRAACAPDAESSGHKGRFVHRRLEGDVACGARGGRADGAGRAFRAVGAPDRRRTRKRGFSKFCNSVLAFRGQKSVSYRALRRPALRCVAGNRGRCADQLFDAWRETVPCEVCGTLGRAVERSRRDACSGEVVLLSPGTASFDQFQSYGARGDAFASFVCAEGKCAEAETKK